MTKAQENMIISILEYDNIRDKISAMGSPIVYLNMEDFKMLESQAVLRERSVKYIRYGRIRIYGSLVIEQGKMWIFDAEKYDIDSLGICLEMYLDQVKKGLVK